MKRKFQNWLRRQLPGPRITQIEGTNKGNIILRRSDGMVALIPTPPLEPGKRWNVNVVWRQPDEVQRLSQKKE